MRVSDADLQQAIDEKVFGSDIGGGFVERALLDLFDLRAKARVVIEADTDAKKRGTWDLVGAAERRTAAIDALRAEVETNEMNAK